MPSHDQRALTRVQELTTTDLIIGMAGAGGDGVVSAGEVLMTGVARDGYHAMMTKSYGSQIRGGESSFRLRIATQEIDGPGGVLDVAVAFDWGEFVKFGAELPIGGATVVVYDAACGLAPGDIPVTGISPAEIRVVPLAELSKASTGAPGFRNMVAVGLLSGWFGIPAHDLVSAVRKRFGRKGPDVVSQNERALEAGAAYARGEPLLHKPRLAAPEPGPPLLLADGNEVCAAAAIFAGCEFFGGYPITPSSEIMHLLSRELWKHGGSVLQAEDEIAGLGAVVGASFAGKKALTATSGPGMSLKTEMLGLASIAELPLVCVNVQRGGPSTGIPTKSEQSDLFQAVFSAHGDVVRPVLAPISVPDTFGLTVEAFNLAERYQTPVVLLSDQAIAQRKETFGEIDTSAVEVVGRRRPTEKELEGYARFRLTESGVSPMSHPGMRGGSYLASGIEHDERGAPTASGELHAAMNEKRIRKLRPLKHRRDLFVTEGSPDAPLGLVSWGSVAGAAREALRLARRDGLQVKLLIPKLLYPVAEEVYQEFFASVGRGFVVEQSHQGQLLRLIRMFVDVPQGVESLARSGSNPILPGDIVDRLHQAVLSLQRVWAPVPE